MSDERPEPIDVVAEFIASEVGFHAEGMREQAQDLLAALTASGWAVAPADIVERHQRLLDAARSAVQEIRGTHYQDPLNRRVCVLCGAADGSWPCGALREADALADAVDGAS